MRRVCVVSGSRAEYGLLRWVLEELRADPAIELRLVVTGTHLSPEFGRTEREIEADGFEINGRVESLVSSDSGAGVAKSIGLGTIGFADELVRQAPDVVLLLGDRFEILAAATAALALRIPIAHCHGGEVTEGSLDDAIRHAITKMARLHLVAAEEHRGRVVRMGEQPASVVVTGAPGLDGVRRLDPLSRDELARQLGLSLDSELIVVTYHPVTTDPAASTRELEALLEALGRRDDAVVVLSRPNADAGGRVLRAAVDAFADEMPQRRGAFDSLGRLRYLSALRHAAVVAGNSSSGIIEAPSFGVPTVNVGDRQRGRVRAASVIDVPAEASGDPDAVAAALERALSPAFREQAKGAVNPWGDGHASPRIVAALKALDVSSRGAKPFYDAAQ